MGDSVVSACRPCANVSTLSPDHRDHSHQEEYLFPPQHLSGLVDKPLSLETRIGSHFPLLGLSFSIYQSGMMISSPFESCLETEG